jgi:DNA invertase Pin-like site-specific DNA recombinase
MEYNIKYVATYIRKSRAENDEDLEKHRLMLTELCTKNNLEFIEYAEIGTSDSIDMRPKMSQLLKDIEKGIFDAVVVVDYDRFGRGDLSEQDRIKKAFQKSQTLIITPDKIYDLNNDSDDTFVDFKGLFARQEYKAITKRLRRGKYLGAMRGEWTNGTPPFPYEYQKYGDKYNPKGLVVNDEKLRTYTYIKESYLAGVSTTVIAVNLNNQHIPSPRNAKWTNVTISRMLADETHLGRIISNKTSGDGHKKKKPSSKPFQKIPKDERVVIENRHEAIKTQEEHDEIINRLEERKAIPFRARQSVYSLSGLIKCGKCGHTHSFLVKDSGKILMKPCWYADSHGNKCINKGIMLNFLEGLIIGEIKKYKDRYIVKDKSNEKKTVNALTRQIESMESQQQKFTKAIDRVNESYELGDYTREQWLDRKKKWENEIADIRGKIYELKKRVNSTALITSTERLENLKLFFEKIETSTTPQERNELYRTIIDRIIWTRNGDDISIHIEYK